MPYYNLSQWRFPKLVHLAPISNRCSMLRLFYHCHGKNASLMPTEVLCGSHSRGCGRNKWVNKGGEKPGNVGIPWFLHTQELIQRSRKKPRGEQSHSIRGLCLQDLGWQNSVCVCVCVCVCVADTYIHTYLLYYGRHFCDRLQLMVPDWWTLPYKTKHGIYLIKSELRVEI